MNKIVILIVSILLVNNIKSQNLMQKPDFINVPYYMVLGSNKLFSFKKEMVGMATKIGKGMWEVKGPNSLERISLSQEYTIIIKAGDFDPSTIVILFKFNIVKKNRQAMIGEFSGGFFSQAKINLSKDVIPYQLEKIEDKIYKIIPDKKLEPGEYMFLVGGTAYTFGVD